MHPAASTPYNIRRHPTVAAALGLSVFVRVTVRVRLSALQAVLCQHSLRPSVEVVDKCHETCRPMYSVRVHITRLYVDKVRHILSFINISHAPLWDDRDM